MAQKYRIYINDNTLFIADVVPHQNGEIQQIDIQDFDFLTFYKNLDKGSKGEYLVLTEDPKAVFRKLKQKCLLIKAAGGLVKNSAGDYLFIFRNKKWDLPKGKVEKNEKMKAAALREVEEECGVKIHSNKDKLCKTYHVYELGGKVVLKKTNWYNMTVKGQPKLIPQKEEGITKAGWFGKDELDPILKKTYLLIFEVLKAGKLI
ncbi:NUDIX hydrolase [Pedobacter nutrimenti]|uniref:NUDIX hydrolase n=1 Tax=Pedobacter nutrimenti TaxID=1241337 RepID=UPI000DA14158|nr:NUDIX domain-containing protein [Pedobacter nutrimenti]